MWQKPKKLRNPNQHETNKPAGQNHLLFCCRMCKQVAITSFCEWLLSFVMVDKKGNCTQWWSGHPGLSILYWDVTGKKSISWAPPCTDTVDDFLDFCLFVQKGFYAEISRDKNETVTIKSILLAFAIAGLLMGDDIETSRSMCSNYWAALRWLSKNQNKRP